MRLTNKSQILSDDDDDDDVNEYIDSELINPFKNKERN